MATIASDTASAAASQRTSPPSSKFTDTPTSEETNWPPTTLRGCASGLVVQAYSSTAEAPKEGMISGRSAGVACSVRTATIDKPVSAPSHDQNISDQLGRGGCTPPGVPRHLCRYARARARAVSGAGCSSACGLAAALASGDALGTVGCEFALSSSASGARPPRCAAMLMEGRPKPYSGAPREHRGQGPPLHDGAGKRTRDVPEASARGRHAPSGQSRRRNRTATRRAVMRSQHEISASDHAPATTDRTDGSARTSLPACLLLRWTLSSARWPSPATTSRTALRSRP